MRSAVDTRTNLKEHFAGLNPLVPVRVVTVVPGVEYYGKTEAIGSDHVMLSTDFHTVTVALAHIVSVHREPHGLLDPGHRNYIRATARTLSTDLPSPREPTDAEEKAPATPQPSRGWRTWFSSRR